MFKAIWVATDSLVKLKTACVQKAAKFLMYTAICEKLSTDKKQSASFLISFYIFIPIVSTNNHPKTI